MKKILTAIWIASQLVACGQQPQVPVRFTQSGMSTQTLISPVVNVSNTPEITPTDWLLRQNPVSGLAWSIDGKILAVSAVTGVSLFDTQTNLLIRTLVDAEFLFPLAIDSQGKRVFAGNRVWDIGSGQLLYQLPQTDISTIAFSPNAKTMVSGDSDSVILWDAQTGDQLKDLTIDVGNAQQGLAYSADGNFLYIISADHIVKQVNLPSGEFMQVFTLPEDSCCTIFSPDGRYGLVNRPNHGMGSKQIWDMEQGILIKDLGQCDSDISFSSFSRDGTYLMIGLCGLDAQLWNTSTQQLLHIFPSRLSTSSFVEWRSVAFSPDGSMLALGNNFGETLIWDMTTFQLIKTLSIPFQT